jgi:hypothetical protein
MVTPAAKVVIPQEQASPGHEKTPMAILDGALELLELSQILL